MILDKEAAELIQEAAAGSLEYATFTKAEWIVFEFSASAIGGVCATSTTGSVEVEIDFTLPSHRAFYDGSKVARLAVKVLETVSPVALTDHQQDDLYGTIPYRADRSWLVGIPATTDDSPTWAEFTGANEIVSFSLRLDLGGGETVEGREALVYADQESLDGAAGSRWVISATVALGVRATTGD